MIRRLAISGLVVIDRAELDPAPGLTAITGETGAGKTVLAQALALLVGAAADARAVRPGARHAFVEATLAIPDGLWDGLDPDDPLTGARELVDDPAEVVVGVRVPAQGRARALIDGQTTTRAAAAGLAGRVVRFSSQHEGRALVAGATQLAVLDAFAGPAVQARVGELSVLRRRLRELRTQRAALAADRASAERERAALEDLVAAVEAAGLDPAEEARLRVDRDRLLNADRLAHAADAAAAALSADSGDGAVDLIGRALDAVAGAGEVDPRLAELARTLAGLQADAQDAASAVRGYLADLDMEPGRLDAIEERLETYDRLSRRYGPGTEAVVAAADRARAALGAISGQAEADEALERELQSTLAAARAAASDVAAARAEAAPRLEQAVTAELADLAMASAQVRIELGEDTDDPPLQRATMWLRANPGLPEARLADAASGGELSRVLLALHGVAARAEPGTTWIFDEVDAGVGGVTATAVAAKLRTLAQTHQVIVITHLPQVAAVADRHYRLVKGADAEGRALTTIEAVEDEALVDELCRMLGAAPEDQGARRHAQELLERRGADAAKASGTRRRQRSGT